jgi:hypothetical protein
MMQLSTKDHLIYFMQTGVLRLSNYDLKFVQNIHTFILQQKPITTNQVSLFEKLVIKYERQFKKQNMSLEFLQALPWTNTIVQSDPVYTDAYISVIDDVIHFRAPYNKNFITNFRKLDYNPFVWNRELKRYEAPFSTMALKILVHLVHYFYPIVHYCPVIVELLNTVQYLDSVKYWNPTLVKTNGNFLIYATNESLHDAVKDIPLNDDLQTMVTLSEYGIEMDSNLLEDKNKLDFASAYVYEIELSKVDKVFEYLNELKCDGIYFSGHSLLIKKDLKDKASKVTANIHNLSDASQNKKLHDYKFPVVMQFSSMISTLKLQTHGIKKVIKIVNSNPVDVK